MHGHFAAGSGLRATWLHAATARIAARATRARRAMWVILLEMGVALALALLIVWWTFPKKRSRDDDSKGPED